MDAFKRFFPTLSEWPAEKWIGVPIALWLLIGCVGGIVNLILAGSKRMQSRVARTPWAG